MIDVAITGEPLDIALAEKVMSPAAGGVAVFVGTVRDHTGGRTVLRLEFEAYQSMAEKEMRKIADAALRRWPVRDIVIRHRVGTVRVGEPAVIIAAGSEHREAAFRACRFAIDTLKTTVPIWKKEIYEDGAAWVQAHP